MADITRYAPKSGRIIGEDGNTYNMVDLLGGGTPVSAKTVDINRYAPQSGRIIGEDGRIYSLVELLQNIGGGGGSGDMTKAVYDTDGDGVVDAAESVPWSGVTGKPSTFTPSSHTHSISEVTNLQAALDGKAAIPTAVEPIEDPTTATAEEIASKLNELIAALKG